MACFNPNLMKCSVVGDPGSDCDLRYDFLGSAKLHDPNTFGTIDDLSTKGYYFLVVPCGHCLGCHIDYSRDWANRMVIELQDNPDAIFLTLTYNNENLPFTEVEFEDETIAGRPTLSVRDLQLFFKRLRKKFPGKRIRYYVAGEYGPKTHRPHYHAIVYGIGLSDFPDLVSRGYNELKDPYFTSQIMENIWSNGFILMSQVTHKTCAYVARYVMKKHYGFNKRELSGATPEFNLSSRRPGIGLLHATDMVLSGCHFFDIDGKDGVHTITLPKSFLRHVSKNVENDPAALDLLSNIVYNRSKDAHGRLLSNLAWSEKSYMEFLESKEKKLFDKIKVLPERSDF